MIILKDGTKILTLSDMREYLISIGLDNIVDVNEFIILASKLSDYDVSKLEEEIELMKIEIEELEDKLRYS